MTSKLPPLIPKHPKYKRYGFGDLFDQGIQSWGQLVNPAGKRTKSKSMKPK